MKWESLLVALAVLLGLDGGRTIYALSHGYQELNVVAAHMWALGPPVFGAYMGLVFGVISAVLYATRRWPLLQFAMATMFLLLAVAAVMHNVVQLFT